LVAGLCSAHFSAATIRLGIAPHAGSFFRDFQFFGSAAVRSEAVR